MEWSVTKASGVREHPDGVAGQVDVTSAAEVETAAAARRHWEAHASRSPAKSPFPNSVHPLFSVTRLVTPRNFLRAT